MNCKLTTMATLGIYSIAAMLATTLDRIIAKLAAEDMVTLVIGARRLQASSGPP